MPVFVLDSGIARFNGRANAGLPWVPERTLPRVNYFRARKALELFREYRGKGLLYWLLFTAPDPDALGEEIAGLADEVNAMPAEELAATRRQSRRRLNELAPMLQRYAAELEVSTKFIVRLPPVAGGGQIEIDALANLTDRDAPNYITNLPPARTLDIIDNCIGAAEWAKGEGLKRVPIPIYWLVDVPRYLYGGLGNPGGGRLAARHRAQRLVLCAKGGLVCGADCRRAAPRGSPGRPDLIRALLSK